MSWRGDGKQLAMGLHNKMVMTVCMGDETGKKGKAAEGTPAAGSNGGAERREEPKEKERGSA